MRANSALNKAFERAGFRLVRSNGHLIWGCPCGHALITSPASPGKGRSVENMKAQIARTLRQCGQQARRAA